MAVRTILDKRAGIDAPTLRKDAWWVAPVITFVVLGTFVVYSTWAAFQGSNYFHAPYLSPLYSPCLASRCIDHVTPTVLGRWWAISPAIAILPFCVFLTWDAVRAFFFPNGFGMGLGTLILCVNALLLNAYTFSCHSARHILSGHVDRFSRARFRSKLWNKLTWLNERHMPIAWASLLVVGFSDLYVRLVASGTIHDPRFF